MFNSTNLHFLHRLKTINFIAQLSYHIEPEFLNGKVEVNYSLLSNQIVNLINTTVRHTYF